MRSKQANKLFALTLAYKTSNTELAYRCHTASVEDVLVHVELKVAVFVGQVRLTVVSPTRRLFGVEVDRNAL